MQKARKNGLPLLAIDLGGTKILAALISAEGKMLALKQNLTLADDGFRNCRGRGSCCFRPPTRGWTRRSA